MEKLKEILFVVRNLVFFFQYKEMFRDIKRSMEGYEVIYCGDQYMFLKPCEGGYEPELQVILYHKDRDKDKEVLDRKIRIPIY